MRKSKWVPEAVKKICWKSSTSNIKNNWTKDEDKKFREAILKFDGDWEQVWKYVETRTME
jgi:hypothetical protein